MAGKVLNALSKGFAGTVSRSADEIIESFVNTDTDAILFGNPVVLNNNGVKNFVGGTSTDPQFVGVAVRIAKTNDTYGVEDAKYNVGELVDVIKRGTVSVAVTGTTAPALGGKVYIAADGTFTADSTGTEIKNCVWKTGKDSDGIAEMAILTRRL